MSEQQTIQSVIQGLGDDLRAYLEAQYHVRDESVLHERKLLLEDGATIAQKPFIEATPAYVLADEYVRLDLPPATKSLLSALAQIPKSGIFTKPYGHQAQALKAFLKEQRDVLAATGTGSGKTEIFLLSILGSLAEECALGPKVTKLTGCRALILYPMNALVSDQLARMRRILGNKDVAALLHEKRGRHVRFGMYTSRTPFPGEITSDLNKGRCRDLLQKFYRPLLENEILLAELKARGKWPAKDVQRFFGRDGMRWDDRLKTGADDVELLMRHEIQAACPDILITNYSMLEYMMLRPIERSIFDQTAKWLENKDTFLTIVLDEAHMYRGATGAEVAFLLRRLFARLGIKRDRVRFILTTASVGGTAADEAAARDFACDLTGVPRTKREDIAFIRGTREAWDSPTPATQEQANALAQFEGGKFAAQMHDAAKVAKALNVLGQKLGWPLISGADPANGLYSAVSHFGPAKLLVTEVSGNALVLDQVALKLFPVVPDEAVRAQAMDSLLRLCNFARDSKTEKVFLPARLHLFFRGLSGLYGCVNPKCSSKRDATKPSLLGRLYPEPRVACDCGARVFEILTHRDCGATFLKGYVPREERPTFLWHEPTTGIGDESSGAELSLQEMELLVTPEPSNLPKQPVWLNITSGQLAWTEPGQKDGWLQVYAPDGSAKITPEITHVFSMCPQCGSKTRNSPNEPSRIMDLRTKGEQPFGQLIKRQLFAQVADGSKSADEYPNQGRKVLIFSDGRQKAARLAKAIPDEVEADAFRELLACGYAKLEPTRRERLQLQKAYAPFVAACAEAKVSPFSGNDAEQVRNDARQFRDIFDGDLGTFIEEGAANSPLAFRTQLYRQACGGLYSMRFICVGWLAPIRRYLKPLIDKYGVEKEGAIYEIAQTWVQELASDTAIDKDFERRRRAEIAGFDKPSWAHNGKFSKKVGSVLSAGGFVPAELEEALQGVFAHFQATEGESGFYLKPDTLVLKIDLAHKWYRCRACFTDSPYRLLGCCPRCGAANLFEFDPNIDPYVQSRKGFWRNPVKAAHDGQTLPRLLSAEEHTAQLSHKDATSGWVKTEEYELRFQDVLADPKNKPAVDVLSCTTTMEVGIDIGSLVAVGLRNVPPQRENYQQRAGRAGRRGSAVSTVVTYCQGGAHDNHYYSHVDEIASGAPRKLTVKVDNAKIARRHVRSFLLQEYFGERPGASSPDILSSLGTLQGFFEETVEGSLVDFSQWMKEKVSAGIGAKVKSWLGNQLEDVKDVAAWATEEAKDFVAKLNALKPKAKEMIEREAGMDDAQRTKLLEFLLAEAILPTYAFPTDLTTFRVEEWDAEIRNLVAKYAPQQAISRALSEYAPGRLLTIDKGTYKSAAVTANVSLSETRRARPLFTNPHRKPYVFCDQKHCCYVEDVGNLNGATRENADCPLCGIGKLRVVEMITPEVFLPEDGREVSALDDDSDYSFATPAQFPVPLHLSGDKQQLVRKFSERLEVFRRADAQLVVVNKGDPDDQSGFHVCDACGRAKLAKLGAPRPSHYTPYKVLAVSRVNARVIKCDGEIKGPVFLGHRFVTDLVILRIQIKPPLCQAPRAMAAEYCALQDALQTLADALPLAAGRMFDVDFTEFSAGYRLINQSGDGASIAAEIYMFDTLSGGAGYSERVGDAMEELLRDYVRKVLACDDEHKEGCDRSCYRCLRHYYNQFYHSRLDRHLALDLLTLILDGTAPKDRPVADQEKLLQGLRVMLDLDGIETQTGGSVDGIRVPLIAKHKGKSVAVCVTHALVAEQFRSGLVDDLDGSSVPLRPLNAYQLTRNLPSCHLAIRKCLGLQPS
jgi:ATP-dependent helicase YprA (DUF1998 family)/predicted  nucleic acid-binding Zn-ribbon protein